MYHYSYNNFEFFLFHFMGGGGMAPSPHINYGHSSIYLSLQNLRDKVNSCKQIFTKSHIVRERDRQTEIDTQTKANSQTDSLIVGNSN